MYVSWAMHEQVSSRGEPNVKLVVGLRFYGPEQLFFSFKTQVS